MITPILTSIAFLLSSASAIQHAEITAAARLVPRQSGTDPAFVGYISQSGGYSNPRTCDYPQTVSTSGTYVQCCAPTGSCAFYTACSSNTLLAAGATVPCDVNSALTCNTGIVLPTAGANGGGSYLACWQTSLGQSPFTFVQNIGSGTVTGSTSAAASGSSARSSSASRTASSVASSASSAASSAASTSKNSGHGAEAGLSGGVVGFLGLLLQAFL